MTPILFIAILLVPVIGAAILFLLPFKEKKTQTILNSVFSFISLILAACLFLQIKPSSIYPLLTSSGTKEILPLSLTFFEADGISTLFILGSSIISFCLSFLSEKNLNRNEYALSQISKFGIYAFFLSQYIPFIIISLTIAFLPLFHIPYKNKKNIVMMIAASIGVLFLSLLTIYLSSHNSLAGEQRFYLKYLIFISRPSILLQKLLFPFLIIAIFILSSIWPAGKWVFQCISKNHCNIFMATVTSKSGLYLLFKVVIPLFSGAIAYYSNYMIFILMILTAITLMLSFKNISMPENFIYSSFSCSSLALMIMMMPVTEETVTGSLLHSFSSMITMTILFSVSVIIKEKTNWSEQNQGFSGTIPFLQVITNLGATSAISLPGFLSFLAFYMLLTGSMSLGYFPVFLFLILFLFFNASSIFLTLTSLFGRDVSIEFFHIKDIDTLEGSVFLVMLILLFISGVVPSYLKDSLINSAQFLILFR